jgi:hypothetical protein
LLLIVYPSMPKNFNHQPQAYSLKLQVSG